jgi:hypothetical protein
VNPGSTTKAPEVTLAKDEDKAKLLDEIPLAAIKIGRT